MTGVMRPPFISCWKRREKSWFLFLWAYDIARDAFGGVNQEYFCYPWYTLQWELFHLQSKGCKIWDSWKTAFLRRLQVKSALMKWEPSNRQTDFIFYSYLTSFPGYSCIPMEGRCSHPASPAPSPVLTHTIVCKGWDDFTRAKCSSWFFFNQHSERKQAQILSLFFSLYITSLCVWFGQ